MNPHKKIEQLKKKIERLEQENESLLYENKEAQRLIKEAKKIKNEYGLKSELAKEQELRYYKLCSELKEQKSEYQRLLHKMKFEINRVDGTYKKAFKEIQNDFS